MRSSSLMAAAVGFIGSTSATPLGSEYGDVERDASQPFVWGVMGDSWASGVAYSTSTMYDSNSDGCLRLQDAWFAQMDADTSWMTTPTKGNFVACSGSGLGSIAFLPPKPQLQQFSTAPSLAIMTTGGNNARFGEIVDNCIFHGYPGVDYGLPYHLDNQGTGKCNLSLAGIESYLYSESTAGLESLKADLTITINDIFRDQAAAGVTDFYLGVTGYAHFFNIDPDSLDCNNWSFAPYWVTTNVPVLTMALREKFNEYVEQVNTVYRNVIVNYQPAPGTPPGFKVDYITITEGFDKGRFCEIGASFLDQFYGEDTLMWNLLPPAPWKYSEVIDASGIHRISIVPGSGSGAPPTIQTNVTAWDNPESRDGVNFSGSGQVLAAGWSLRPFHPTNKGHTAIKMWVVQRLQQVGNIPGVKPATSTTGTGTTCPSTLPADCSTCPNGYGDCTFNGAEDVCTCNAGPCAGVTCFDYVCGLSGCGTGVTVG